MYVGYHREIRGHMGLSSHPSIGPRPEASEEEPHDAALPAALAWPAAGLSKLNRISYAIGPVSGLAYTHGHTQNGVQYARLGRRARRLRSYVMYVVTYICAQLRRFCWLHSLVWLW